MTARTVFLLAGAFALRRVGAAAGYGKGEREVAFVVPATGTEELTGIAGQMILRRQDGRTLYHFEYSLPAR